jgi:integrase
VKEKNTVTYSNILDWANQYPSVTTWLGKIQEKNQSAYRLWQFCSWAKTDPEKLLSLKSNPASKEAERLLDRFVASSDLTESVRFNVSSAVKSFFKHNYCDLARASGALAYTKVKPYHRLTKVELKKLHDPIYCLTPRDRSIISLLASTAIAKETVAKLMWKHLEEDWEKQEIPHISIPPELIKGHGKGKYQGVRQETFLTPTAKKDLITYKNWIEEKMGRKFENNDPIYVSVYAPYEKMAYATFATAMRELSLRAKIPFSPHDFRRYVETALESINIHPNWARKIRGRKVRGEESPYSQPAIEQLREKYREAVDLLEFTGETDLSERLKRLEAAEKIQEKLMTGEPLDEEDRVNIHKFQLRIGREASAEETREDCEKAGNKRKVIGEDELENHLNHGFNFVSVLPSGKILVEQA